MAAHRAPHQITRRYFDTIVITTRRSRALIDPSSCVCDERDSELATRYFVPFSLFFYFPPILLVRFFRLHYIYLPFLKVFNQSRQSSHDCRRLFILYVREDKDISFIFPRCISTTFRSKRERPFVNIYTWAGQEPSTFPINFSSLPSIEEKLGGGRGRSGGKRTLMDVSSSSAIDKAHLID